MRIVEIRWERTPVILDISQPPCQSRHYEHKRTTSSQSATSTPQPRTVDSALAVADGQFNFTIQSLAGNAVEIQTTEANFLQSTISPISPVIWTVVTLSPIDITGQFVVTNMEAWEGSDFASNVLEEFWLPGTVRGNHNRPPAPELWPDDGSEIPA
jgi:hypothetical protein